jgi:Concanavalin A-like lectin/glucanases superfamily/Domain of unknown function (DUF2341)
MTRCLLLLFVSLIAMGCGNDSLTKGGGTNVGDEAAMVTGIIKDKQGPTAGAIVLLHSKDFNPGMDTVLKTRRYITGEDGKYVFTVLDTGVYNIEASQPEYGTKALLQGIRKTEKKLVASELQMQTPGQITIHIPELLSKANGYVYLPGTSLYSKVQAGTMVELLSVPPLQDMQIIFSDEKNGAQTTLAQSVNLAAAGSIQVSKFNLWAHRAEVKINTAQAGIALEKDIENFPILVRLNSENFVFSHANIDGSDLRITKADGITPLNFEIERWNSALAVAEIWVSVDTLYSSWPSQTLLLHYGNPDVLSLSNGKKVFDPEKGFRGAWHLGENSTSSTVKDAAGRINGILKAKDVGIFTSSVSKPNIIGTGFEFKNQKNGYWIDLGADQNFVNSQGELTLSMWLSVNVDTAHSPNVFAVSVAGPITEDPKSRLVLHFEKGLLSFLARAEDTATNMLGFNIDPGVPIEQWFHIAGVMDINSHTAELYVNGKLLKKIDVDFVKYTMDIGNSTHGAIGANDIGNGNYFSGLLDEVRLDGKARSADWVRLCYENQRMGQVLVTVQSIK